MANQEVGRWPCDKCRQTIVAAGPRSKSLLGVGLFAGQCPWDCGAWIQRGFRFVKSGQVTAYRADEWDQRPISA